MFDNIHKQDTTAETALLQHEAVLDLWHCQSRVLDIVNRAFQSGCVREIQVKAWTRNFNSTRRTVQDRFLLETSLKIVKERINEASSKFERFAREIEDEVISLERTTDIETRLKNIDEVFKFQFRELYENHRLNSEILQDLEKQVALYKLSLIKNFNDRDLRPEIRTRLLHDLVDDYYEHIHQIYTEVMSSVKKL